MLFILGMISIGVFAITSVIATQNKKLDIFSAVFLGAVTALGGGTIRDMILGNYPVYWVSDLTYLWTATITPFIAFFLVKNLSNSNRILLYMDALGIALFSITAAAKTIKLGFTPPIAVVMGLITAIFGGILRDVLAGSPSLLLRKEMYATPVLLGLCIYIALNKWLPNPNMNIPLSIVITFIFRACAIHFKLHYPHWLTSK